MAANLAFFLVLSAAITLGNFKYIDQDFKNVKMHPACVGQYYCLEKPHNYPDRLISDLVNKQQLVLIDSTTEHRDSSGITSPCRSNSSSSPIYQIKDAKGSVRYVVQTKKFQQIIKLEWCQNKGPIIRNVEGLPFDVDELAEANKVASCEELYSNYKFLVLSKDGKYLEAVDVGKDSIPVCCRCKISDLEVYDEMYKY